MRLLLPLLLCFACTDVVNPDEETDWRDVSIAERELPPAPPEGQGFQIVTPIITIEPGVEQFWCFYGTYTGPTVGVNRVVVHQDPQFSHHSLLKAVRPNESETRPDGTLRECTDPAEQIPARPTLFESVGLNEPDEEEEGGDHDNVDDWIEGYDYVTLPDNIAFKFTQDERWMADLHFINWSTEAIQTRVVFDLWTVPEEGVDHFVGTFNHDVGGLSLPAGEVTTLNFTCTFEEGMTVLAIGGHMHSWGTRFRVDQEEDGDLVRASVFDVNPWEPDMRYVPIVDYHQPGEFIVEPGQSFRTWCTWDNREDRPLGFPDEMCTTFGVGYPIEQSGYCIADDTANTGPPP